MPLFEMTDQAFRALNQTSFADLNVCFAPRSKFWETISTSCPKNLETGMKADAGLTFSPSTHRQTSS